MVALAKPVEEISTYCPLCTSRCGAKASLRDGRLEGLKPDPSHPTGSALCIKGKVAPELVYHPQRLTTPLLRTRPKGAPDPGWRPISWDEALTIAATRLRALADEHGAESVAFSTASSSTSAMVDSKPWIDRLRRAFGSPNLVGSMELCGWGRQLAPRYMYGAADYMPELDNAGCILFWGYNPTASRIVHATQAAAAVKRGAKLIVVDPRKAGLARRADAWLRVRPGSDAALALSIANVMLERGWYDEQFMRTWTNAPLLVRCDDGRLLRASAFSGDSSDERLVAFDEAGKTPVRYDPRQGKYDCDPSILAMCGSYTIETTTGPVLCRPAFGHIVETCAKHAPSTAETVCGVKAADIEHAAELLWSNRPTAYFAWSGLEQQSNATQISRAIGLLYALTGCLDAPGGNVEFPRIPVRDVTGGESLSITQKNKALGLHKRPFGPSRWEWVTAQEFYDAALAGTPYRVRGLAGFGANLLLAHGDSDRGREALRALDFYLHADLFMNPTAEMADIVLPVTSAFEAEGLKVGFEVSPQAQSLVQLRRPLVQRRGECRSDIEIVFALAARLGLGDQFWQGDIDAAYTYLLEPSGVTLDALRAQPQGVRVPLKTGYRKHAQAVDGAVRGFNTPSHKIEIYSEVMVQAGLTPVPEHSAPLMSHDARPDLAGQFPLILTCAKSSLFCETQHRGLPSLRQRAMDPQVDLHPDAASARGIEAGDWVQIATPHAKVKARARLDHHLDPAVVCGQHGWWEACTELNAPGHDPFSDDGANFNRLIGHGAVDPVGGSVPHRAYLCEITRAGDTPA
ncbi:MAG: molybdopterin-dependent oxidoreductase [Gammaproteobacteria bacterium]|nr:molybdopterin-dependent oxidoreductase [Gammaproteobacteria bacterium]